MKIQHFLFFLAIVLLGSFLSCKTEEYKQRTVFDATAVDVLVETEMQKRKIPGVVLAIVRNDSVLYKKTYGVSVVEHQVPMKFETKFEIASLTKQFVVTGILLLVQDGQLGLDVSINNYLEDIPANWEELTLRQLLSHTAGLAPQDSEYKSLKKNGWPKYVSRKMMFESATLDSVYCQPGDFFIYHNVGYFLAEMIIEEVTGKDYLVFFQERIFNPLGMENTYFEDQLKVEPDQAQGYSIKNGELVKIWRVSQEEMGGGWGIYSCIDDMLKWNRALDNHLLLKPEIQAQMFQKIKLNNGNYFRYGLGWFLPKRNGIQYYYHNGITGPEFLKIPNRNLSIIILSNLGNNKYDEADPWGIADKIAGEIFYPDFKYAPIPVPVSGELLKNYVGKFKFKYGEAVFFQRNGGLVLSDKYGEEELIHVGENNFALPSYPMNIRFLDNDTALISEDTWEDDIGRRVAD